jgi:hypothetical protein
MSTALLAAKVVLTALALVAAFRLRAPGRPALALVALLVPIALSAPGTVREGVDDARRNAALSEREAGLYASGVARRGRNLPLTLAAEREIPEGSVYGVVVARRAPLAPRELRERAAGIAWTKFRLAPRIATSGTDADWVLVYDATPERAGIEPSRAWRFGDDWLVRR